MPLGSSLRGSTLILVLRLRLTNSNRLDFERRRCRVVPRAPIKSDRHNIVNPKLLLLLTRAISGPSLLRPKRSGCCEFLSRRSLVDGTTDLDADTTSSDLLGTSNPMMKLERDLGSGIAEISTDFMIAVRSSCLQPCCSMKRTVSAASRKSSIDVTRYRMVLGAPYVSKMCLSIVLHSQYRQKTPTLLWII